MRIFSIDATLETNDALWIFEFKLNDSAESALAKIEEKKYYQKYLQTKNKITLIGVEFDTEKRNIAHWVIKELEKERISSPPI